MNHYNVTHANELNFNVKCNVSGCPLVFRRYNSYYRHVVRHHTNVYNLIDDNTPGNGNFLRNIELEQNDNGEGIGVNREEENTVEGDDHYGEEIDNNVNKGNEPDSFDSSSDEDENFDHQNQEHEVYDVSIYLYFLIYENLVGCVYDQIIINPINLNLPYPTCLNVPKQLYCYYFNIKYFLSPREDSI